MRIDVYRGFVPIEIISSYNGLEATRLWRGVGTIKLIFNNTDIYKNLTIKTDYILVNGECYILENKSKVDTKETKEYTLEGRHINSLLNRRVSADVAIASGANYETIAYNLINNNFINPTDNARKINNFIFKTNGITTITTTAYTLKAGSIDTMLNNLLSNVGLGYNITYDISNQRFVFEVLEGQDLSNNVIFGDKFNNVSEIDIYEQSDNYKNTGYVWNEQEQTLTPYGTQTYTGLDRRELLSTSDDSASSDLQKYKEVLGADFEPKKSEQYVYNVDYKLGDKVRFVDKNSNLEAVRPLLEVKEYWENTHDIELTFGDSRPTIIDKLRS